MKRKHPAGKHREKKHLIGNDQLNPQEKIASLKALFEGSKDVIYKPPGEPVKREETSSEKISQAINKPVITAEPRRVEPPCAAKLITSATTATNIPPSISTLLEQKRAHQNPIEQLEKKCKKIAEHVQSILKQLF